MGLKTGALELHESARIAETAAAFDGVASTYHRSNIENPILQHYRTRARDMLVRYVNAGARVLDLGCGPGTDFDFLAAAGFEVTGIDASTAMVAEAARRAQVIEAVRRPTVRWHTIQHLERLGQERFDAVFSNFGPLNCVSDLADVARQLQAVLRPGGVVTASVIGRWCPWEWGIYLRQGNVARAALRLRRGATVVPLEGRRVHMRYFSPREFLRAFGRAGFECLALEGLGVLAPPPFCDAFAARHPSLTQRLLDTDAIVGRWPAMRHLGDHFLVTLART